MRRYLYITCLFLSLGFMARGADTLKQVKAKLVIHNDTGKVLLRAFDKAPLARYRTQREFQYSGNGYAGESLWPRFWRWFWHLFTTGEREGFFGLLGVFLTYLFIALGIAALVFLILKLAGVDAFSALTRKSKLTTLPYNELVENIYQIDLDAEIEKAVGQQNYRLAVRLLYLRLLKQLSDADLINWDITKTNNIYIDELTNAEQRMAFKMITRQFEYVWYGEFIIDAQVFKRISTAFAEFKIRMA